MILKFYKSTIGKKIVVALTGAALLLFVIGHMLGNLKGLAGFDQFGVHKLDRYAQFLRDIGSSMFGHAGFLWLARIGLLIALILHVVTVIQLKQINLRSRPDSYATVKYSSATLASRSMFLGGVILLFFIVYHLLHLTFGTVHFSGFVEGQVYNNVYSAFQNPLVLAVYSIAMLVLGFHIFHGAWSLFQTLGIDGPKRNSTLRALAACLAVFLVVGFLSLPIAAYLQVLPAPNKPIAAALISDDMLGMARITE